MLLSGLEIKYLLANVSSRRMMATTDRYVSRPGYQTGTRRGKSVFTTLCLIPSATVCYIQILIHMVVFKLVTAAWSGGYNWYCQDIRGAPQADNKVGQT